jgi:rhodanese-related sulfurtransferase
MQRHTIWKFVIVSTGALSLLVTAGMVIRSQLLSKQTHPISTEESGKLVTGARITIEGIDWAKNQKTAVLAISMACGYCNDSSPFYQRLAETIKTRKDVKFVALLKERVEDGERYFQERSIPVFAVKQIPLYNFGVRATPTLMVVDNTGLITDIWVGLLKPVKEAQVFQRLGMQDTKSIDVETSGDEVPRKEPKQDSTNTSPVAAAQNVTSDEVKHMIGRGEQVIILDVRNRNEFGKDHLRNAKNIPVDELDTRAVNELSLSDFVLVYCHCPEDGSDTTAYGILKKAGFKKVRVYQ